MSSCKKSSKQKKVDLEKDKRKMGGENVKIKYIGINKGARLRNVFITLGKTSDFCFTCGQDEKNKIIDSIKEFIRVSDDYIIVQAEKYSQDETQWHYHIVFAAKNCRRSNCFQKIAESLDDLFPDADIRVEKIGNLPLVIGYIYKERDMHEPEVIGKVSDLVINSSIELYRKKKHANPIVKKSKFRSNEDDEESLLINTVKEFMNQKDIKINSITRELMGIEYSKFFYLLEKELNLSDTYSVRGAEKIKRLIQNDCHYVLPMWFPELDIIGFSDYDYSISLGKKIKKNKDVTPFYDTQQEFPGKYPKEWISVIETNKFPLNEFIKAFSFFYKKKERRDKVLYISGETQTGKSSLIEPYSELYKNIACYVSQEGNFSFSHIQKYPKLIINEYDIMTSSCSGMNQIKNLLEGSEFNIVRKGKSQEKIGKKNVVITTNSSLPDIKYLDPEYNRDILAMISRLHIYETLKKAIKIHDPEIIRKITMEAPAVCVLCTQKENYINLQ